MCVASVALLHVPDHGNHTTTGLSDLVQGPHGIFHKLWLEQEVFRGRAGNGQLGEYDQVGFCLLCFSDPGRNAVKVAGQISDCRVHLCQCDSQRPHSAPMN